ncbi:hypothetical protein FRC04_003329 [Tulasnella sp. 424]|nr:hypothetical protein FRC04_003329 [Tulasnella sp. 424]KAG8977147.1 hypothetical protein FRC05_002144 [Tulasnella sp. 425]
MEHSQGSPIDIDFSENSLHDDPTSGTSSSSSPYSVSKAEREFYYLGLCSSPKLVYRTGTTPWKKPTGPEAYPQLKELRPVFGHKLNIVWKDLGPKVYQLLDSQGVLWTTIDAVRFLKVGEEAVGPVVLWIGVAPETLCAEDARTAANGCLDLLKEFDITDIEVEYRESIYTRSAGPNLLTPVSYLHPTVDVRGPLTPALGLSIAAQATPHAAGTGGLYLAEGGDSKKVLLVTARHVLFPPNEGPNVGYAHTDTSARRRKVLLLGTKAFENLVGSIKIRIGGLAIGVELYEREITMLRERLAGEGEDDVEEATRELKMTQSLLDKANKAIETLEKFHDEVKKEWSRPSQRVLGHIARSPPLTLGAGTEGFTEDYAVVELDSSKIKVAFKGNVIDLGTTIPPGEFASKMYPRADAASTFKYPYDRLLQLRDLISEDLMRNPDMLDHDGEPCLLVIKNGNTTGVTIGRATGIFSYVREYFTNNTHQTSMEWAILPYDHKSGAFSAPGDSGSIIADGLGRIGGLLTGGAGRTESSDITYATPFFWLFPRIKENGYPNAHLNPVTA